MAKRRGRGEGSIFQRKDGFWCGAVTVGYDQQGKRRRRVVYGNTKTEILEEMTRLRHAALTGTFSDTQRLTVAGFLSKWLESAARPAIRESTYQLYAMVVRRHIVTHLGGVSLAKLAPAHVQGLLADLEREGASPRLRQIVFAVLHRAMSQAVQWGMIPRNSCDAAVRPRVPRMDMQALTPEQARRFLAAARTDRLHGLYAVLVGCGLRLGEALGLTWPDVDLERGTLTVRQQLSEVNGRIWLQEPKTERARRTVDLPPFAAAALREHQERARAEGTLLNDLLLVFTDSEANPVRKSNLRRRSFLPLLRRAGMPRIRLHDLRHTAATLHLRQGTHPSVVQQMLGHSRVGITLDVYSHVLPTLGKEAAQRLDELLSVPDASGNP